MPRDPIDDATDLLLRRRPLTDGVAYALPVRMAGKPMAVGMILVGGALGGFGLWATHPALHDLYQGRMPGSVLELAPLLFAGAGLIPAGLGLLMLLGRNTVELRRDRVRAIDHLGPLRWTRQRPADSIRKLEVNTATSQTNGGPTRPIESFALLTALAPAPPPPPQAARRARYKGAFILAWGYHRDLLRALADDLARELDPDLGRLGRDEHQPAVTVVESLGAGDTTGLNPPTAASEEPTVEMPANTRITLSRTPTGLTLNVPPTGFWKGSKGLGCFGIAWCAFMTVFTVLFMGTLLGLIPNASSDVDSIGEILGVVAFISLFWAVGVGTLLGALNAGKRKAILDVVGTPPHATLLVSRQSLFKTRQQEWPADQISHLCIGPSGVEVNDVPVMQLHIHPRNHPRNRPRTDKKIGMLSQLSNEELAWVAFELRQALGVPAHATDPHG